VSLKKLKSGKAQNGKILRQVARFFLLFKKGGETRFQK
jgi:hypothetical protein